MYKVAVLGKGLFRLSLGGTLEIYSNGVWQQAKRKSLVDLPKNVIESLCRNSGVNRSQISTDFD